MALLDEIARVTREKVAQKKGAAALSRLRSKITDRAPTRGFLAALSSEGGGLRLIAEIKKASPSKGMLRASFDPVEIAKIYEKGGASALSVLTEERYFLGALSSLDAVSSSVSLPILQKDFILDEFQLYEARALGADAVLLIVALLGLSQLSDYYHLARELSLDVLVEVHDEAELEKVIAWAPLIGVNNRNLRDFCTDLATTFRLIKTIPDDRTVVSESGIHSREQMAQLQACGVDAVLVGESLMRSEKIEEKIKALLGK